MTSKKCQVNKSKQILINSGSQMEISQESSGGLPPTPVTAALEPPSSAETMLPELEPHPPTLTITSKALDLETKSEAEALAAAAVARLSTPLKLSTTNSAVSPPATLLPLAPPPLAASSITTAAPPIVSPAASSVSSENSNPSVVGPSVTIAGQRVNLKLPTEPASPLLAAAAMNPLLLNPFMLTSSMTQLLQQQQQAKQQPLFNEEELLKSMKNLLPDVSMLSPLHQLRKPNIADTLSSVFGEQDLSRIRQVLEAVNATVTKSLLEDNLRKWGQELLANNIFSQLAQVKPIPPEDHQQQTQSYESDVDMFSDDDSQDNLDDSRRSLSGAGAQVGGSRVRSQISDEQVAVLKACYNINSKPRREELQQIADKIGHPFKVIKVWFQNSRARDRREGRQSTSSQRSCSPLPPPPQATAVFPPSAAKASSSQSISTLAFNALSTLQPAATVASSAAGSQQPPLLNLKSLNPLPVNVVFSKFPTPPASSTDSQHMSPSLSPQPSLTKAAGAVSKPLDLSTKRSTPCNTPPPLVINSNPESEDEDEDNQSEEEEIEPHMVNGGSSKKSLTLPPNLTLNDAKAQFEKMVQDKLTALSPSASTIIKLPTQPEPMSAVVITAGTAAANEDSCGSLQVPAASPAKKDDDNSSSTGSTTTPTVYSCDQCDKTFTKKSSITRHKYEHSGMYFYTCYNFAKKVFLILILF